MKKTEYKLKNGLRVIHNYKSDSKMVDVRLMLGAGNFYNNYYNYTPGLAHFLEHVVHEKTEKYSDKETLTAIVIDDGGSRNAATYGNEKMIFFATVLKDFAENACDYISQVVFHSIFDQTAVDKHRKIILEELMTKFKQPSAKAMRLFGELAYENSDFIYHTLGTEESLEKITLEELRKYYDDRFIAESSILSISGDISFEDCQKLVEKYFSSIKTMGDERDAIQIENINTDLIADINDKKQDNVLIQDKQAVVDIGAVFNGVEDKKYFSLIVLARFLTATSNSILNKRLREERKLIYSIGSNWTSNQLFGHMYFSLNVQPENIQECLDIIKYEINEIANEKITEMELDRTKKNIMASEIFYNQSIQDESESIMDIKLKWRDLNTREDYLKKFDSVTRTEVVETAKWLYENLNILAVCSNSENKYNF